MGLTYRFLGFLLLVSAFLLFLVQPLVSKTLLPVLGGTPAVWTTSMLFFQILLLGGYCWAHVMIRYMPLYIPPLLQLIMIITGFFMIHTDGFTPPDFTTTDPVWWQLKTMFFIVGIPYFVLATNAPLYQALYRNFTQHTSGGKTPYALYSLSNIGSFVALASYPFLFEPLLTLGNQSLVWKIGYGILCVLVAGSAFLFYRIYRKEKPALTAAQADNAMTASKDKNVFSWKPVSLWLLLAFIPSSLMLGVTSHVTTDIASLPLLWIIPLAAYLTSFIIAFAEPPLWWARHDKKAFSLAIMSAAIMLLTIVFPTLKYEIFLLIVHYTGFFMVATYCHLLLAQSKPDTKYLTGFFIIVSCGGALGGVFNALLAYHIFNTATEYGIILCLFVIFICFYKRFAWHKLDSRSLYVLGIFELIAAVFFICAIYFNMVMVVFLFCIICLMVFYNYRPVMLGVTCVLCFIFLYKDIHTNDIVRERNVFGVVKVRDRDNIRQLVHGTTLHGLQTLPLSDSPTPTSYYHPQGPLGDVFRILDEQKGPQNIAVLGMGTAATGCYIKNGREFDFYEIDKNVVKIASNPDLFTYLSACQPNADIILGDARIGIQKQPDASYDMILLDVFSSDAIPLHILTKEAFDIYREKLKPEGFIVFHISNRFFDLTPVIANIATQYGYPVIKRTGVDKIADDPTYNTSIYVVVSASDQKINDLTALNDAWKTDDLAKPSQKIWTDNYANIFAVMKF
tara:strand:+ start:906 stop:3110 length:2205 start_codon:yes stop_codon:yes gene_type:complete